MQHFAESSRLMSFMAAEWSYVDQRPVAVHMLGEKFRGFGLQKLMLPMLGLYQILDNDPEKRESPDLVKAAHALTNPPHLDLD